MIRYPGAIKNNQKSDKFGSQIHGIYASEQAF